MAGAPRANYTGQIVLYSVSENGNVTVIQAHRGDQVTLSSGTAGGGEWKCHLLTACPQADSGIGLFLNIPEVFPATLRLGGP